MTRTFEPQAIISLPRLSANDTVTLAQMLDTQVAAESGALPDSIVEAAQDLKSRLQALSDGLANRKPEGASPEAIEADVVIDRAWGGFNQWLSGWARAGVEPESGEAQALLARLFPDGLVFLNTRYSVEWSESNTKLDVIKKEELEATIIKLGGEKLLSRLRQTHQQYGEALGITQARTPEQEPPDIRELMDEAHDSMREFIAVVVGSVRRKKPESKALAARLLLPLTEWKDRAPSTQGASATEAGANEAGVTSTETAGDGE